MLKCKVICGESIWFLCLLPHGNSTPGSVWVRFYSISRNVLFQSHDPVTGSTLTVGQLLRWKLGATLSGMAADGLQPTLAIGQASSYLHCSCDVCQWPRRFLPTSSRPPELIFVRPQQQGKLDMSIADCYLTGPNGQFLRAVCCPAP